MEFRINTSTWHDWGSDRTRTVQITNNDYIQFRNKSSHLQDGSFSTKFGYVYVSFTDTSGVPCKYKASGPLSSLVDKYVQCDAITGDNSFHRFFRSNNFKTLLL